MADSSTELIKSRLSVQDLLKQYVTLIPAGRNFKARCPFHNEKSPSFIVSPERQTWHCFGCGLHGDIFSFVMQHDHLEFGEALRILAEKAGVELRQMNPQEYKFHGLLYDLNEEAKNFFVSELGRSELALKYVSGRGLLPETIKDFQIGFAPPESDRLTMHFLNKKVAPEDLLRAGLSFKSERGSYFDRFRGRIMFPIHNHLGKIVAFTGRVLPEFDNGQMGKYVNSPETAIFNKSRVLYGFFKSKGAIAEKNEAYLVEGQMDFLMSYQAGVKNAIATSGTALTLEHLRLIRRLTDRLVVSFDSDEAGLDAGERAIDLAEGADFDVRVVTLPPPYKDPAEAAEAGKEVLFGAIKDARPAMQFYFDRYLPQSGFDVRKRDSLDALRKVLKKLKTVSSPAAQITWFRDLSRRTGLDEKILIAESDQLEVAEKKSFLEETKPPEPLEQKKLSRWELLSLETLSVAFGVDNVAALGVDAHYLHPNLQPVYDVLKAGERSSPDAHIDELLNSVILRSDTKDPALLETLLTHLRTEYVRERRRVLTWGIKQAEQSGKESEKERLLQELSELPIF